MFGVMFTVQVLNETRPLRIGYLSFNGVFEAVPAMTRAVVEVKELLEATGHQVQTFCDATEIFKFSCNDHCACIEVVWLAVMMTWPLVF